MDRIKVNGGYLVTDESFFIPWRSFSGFFSEDAIPGIETLPFKIPNDPEGINARLLNFPHILNVVTDLPRKYVAEAYVGGFKKLRLWLEITNGTRRWFEAKLYTSSVMEDQSIFDMSLRELMDEVVTLVAPPTIKIKFLATGSGAGPFTFQLNTIIYELEWDTDLTTTLLNIKDAVDADTANNGCTMDILGGGYFHIIPNEPGPKCNIQYLHVTDTEDGTFTIEIADETGWLVDYNDDLHAAMLALVNVTGATNPLCFPTIYNKGFYGYTEGGTPDMNPDFSGFLNFMNVGGDYMLNLKTGEAFDGNKYSVSPQVFVRRVLDVIEQRTKLQFAGDFFEHDDINRLYFQNNRSLDCIFRAQIEGQDYLTFYGEFNLADFVPDITVRDLLPAIRMRFCVGNELDYSKMTNTYLLRGNAAQVLKYIDVNDLPYLDDPNLRYEDAITGIKFLAAADPNDNAVTDPTYEDQHAAYSVGTNPTEYTMALGIASKGYIARADVFYTSIWCPVLDMLGSSLEFGVGINEFTPRLMIYRGMSEDTNGNEYPYGTNDNTLDGEEVAGLWSLTPAGNYTTFWNFWAQWIINAIPVEASILIDGKRLLDFHMQHKYKFYDTSMFFKEQRVEQKYGDDYLTRVIFLARAAGKGV